MGTRLILGEPVTAQELFTHEFREDTHMAIENLGEPHLGTTVIPKEERVAWPGLRFVPPAKIEFIAAESVVNEVYFCRSTAMARAKELLRADVIYMVFHLGVLPDSMYHSTFGAGIVVADE